MDIIKLSARPRTGSGKSYTRKARAQGWVPAIFYGRNVEPVQIEVNHKEFATLVRTKKLTHLINLGIGKSEEDSIAVIREVQRHVIKNDLYYHIDFHHVAMNEKITVEVPLVLSGTAVGVKDGGVLGSPIKTVKVECMPADIPENVTIDVSALKIGDSIHVRDVSIPKLTLKESSDEVLAVVTLPTREEVEEITTAEGAAAAAGPAGAAAEGAAAPAKTAAAAPAKAPAAPAKKK